ncbi:MAG: DNA repair protein RadA [Candidatus Marinimicrobia bacterium]|nr:DNA repair protein RadA [Candidatus Neomarinimicrobiota bacterium]MCF7828698.1 DNA repair protein RadA [Candidatus Neomarinimicrobiota bacterium]MCF7880439.1 DNA repair protein RadA [Candidatus Neomarinimicrobiota bacterium]
MAKKRTIVYSCTECGAQFPKWQGRCTECGTWNSLVEETKSDRKKRSGQVKTKPPINIKKIKSNPLNRIPTGIGEFNRVVGGGLIPGSVVLLGGHPGIGKSTIMLQILGEVAEGTESTVCYFSGEESETQIGVRADRLGIDSDRVLISNENNVEGILSVLDDEKPIVAVVDSIQTAYTDEVDSLPGNVSQVRESAALLQQYAKEQHCVMVLVGHITKEGRIAGPKMLEHLVDTVLYLEGDNHHFYRILRSVKNRFGATNEVGIFEMTERGMQPVGNPSDMFLQERNEHIPGSVVVPSMEGTRPFLVELQALASQANYGTPQKNATGVDIRRLSLLLAVLEKRVGMHIGTNDIFVNLVGGLQVEEPAIDMGIITAVASSFREIPVDGKTLLIGEVGLGGEVRSVSHIDARIQEGKRMGFERVILPWHNKKDTQNFSGIKVERVRTVQDAFEILW